MFNKKVNLILFISLFLTVTATAQESKDGGYVDDFLNENVMDFIYTARPMIEVNYGIGYPGHNNITGDFASVGSWDLKLGKSERKIYKGILLDLNERYVFGSYTGSAQQSYFDTEGDILTTAYKFGFGSRDGIGYGGSFLSVTPYVSQDFVWTKLSDYTTPTAQGVKIPNLESPILNDYYGTFRFGDKSSYGVKLEFASIFQVNAFYETSVVYRRHLFWYWSGSFLVSQIGYNILARFTDEIVDSSPVLGPIVNFALKAGYLYGYYLLRKDNMNWPFNPNGNEVPLTYDTINVGFTMVF
ncbi:hypothetical protein MNBD_IGNAVI01-1376 [hydrothermal vent metagenome]|uniref:Uncharacterized protein n=1 Tax=hydrothermal vent metagenome TaxID=652676 RepID=A0A3B1CUN4_9ZZZZ